MFLFGIDTLAKEMLLKWYYDQKKLFFFSLDFKTMLTKH